MTSIPSDCPQIIENFVSEREVLLNEVTLLIHELGMMNLENNGIAQIGQIRNSIQVLKTTEDELTDQVKRCEVAFEKTIEERSHKLLTLKLTTCLEKKQYEAAFRLMVDHPEWVDEHMDLALRGIQELTHQIYQNDSFPKSLGDLVSSLFRNNPPLEKKALDFTFEMGDTKIQSNLLLVLTNFSTLFCLGSNVIDFQNPRITLDCNPESLRAILKFLVSKDEESLLPLLEENFITANKYGINYVSGALRNQMGKLKKSMDLSAWVSLIKIWLEHPVLKYLTSFPTGRELRGTAPIEFTAEHEGRILYSLNLLEQFAIRIETGAKWSYDSYFNLYQVKEAADLLLRSTSSGQIQEDLIRFDRYKSLLDRICGKYGAHQVTMENMYVSDKHLLLIHEGELLTPFDEIVKMINPIFMSCISAKNMLEPIFEQKLVDHEAWHGDCLKQALYLIGKKNDCDAQKLVLNFAERAIFRRVFEQTEAYHVLFRPSSSTPSAIVASYWSPVTKKLGHTRIQATRHGEEWSYSKLGNPELGSFSTPTELMAHLWRHNHRPIRYVPRPLQKSEILQQYIDR